MIDEVWLLNTAVSCFEPRYMDQGHRYKRAVGGVVPPTVGPRCNQNNYVTMRKCIGKICIPQFRKSGDAPDMDIIIKWGAQVGVEESARGAVGQTKREARPQMRVSCRRGERAAEREKETCTCDVHRKKTEQSSRTHGTRRVARNSLLWVGGM